MCILTWKCASRHNSVQLFISHLASWLRTRRFSEPTFRPFGATNQWKNTVFRDLPSFSRTWIFFFLRLFLSELLFSSLLFSDSSNLLFLSVHIVEVVVAVVVVVAVEVVVVVVVVAVAVVVVVVVAGAVAVAVVVVVVVVLVVVVVEVVVVVVEVVVVVVVKGT